MLEENAQGRPRAGGKEQGEGRWTFGLQKVSRSKENMGEGHHGSGDRTAEPPHLPMAGRPEAMSIGCWDDVGK